MGLVVSVAGSVILAGLIVYSTDLGALLTAIGLVGAAFGTGTWTVAAVRRLAGVGAPQPYEPADSRGEFGAMLPYLRVPVLADLRDHWRGAAGAASWLLGWIGRADSRAAFLWPLMMLLAAGTAAAVAAVVALAVLYSTAALVFALAWRGLWLLGVPLLRAAHAVHDRRTSRVVVCPEGNCGRSSDRPTFRCTRGCSAHLDRFPSAAGVLWVRDLNGHRRSTLPFLGEPGAAHCPHCASFLGDGADRDRHRQVLVTGPDTDVSVGFARTGLAALLDLDRGLDRGPDRVAVEAAMRRATEPLRPGQARPDLPALRFERPAGAPVRLYCRVAAAAYLASIDAGSDLAAFDECESVAFVVALADGRPAEPDAVRQQCSVLRQRLTRHRSTTRGLRVAIVLSGGSGDPAAIAGLGPLKAGFDADLPGTRWFADEPERAWRWLATAAPGTGRVGVIEPRRVGS